VQPVHITTKVVSSNPVHGEVHSIQHYVIKFVSDLRQVAGFLWFPPRHNITEILLKVALHTINPNPLTIMTRNVCPEVDWVLSGSVHCSLVRICCLSERPTGYGQSTDVRPSR
jgi:hypothetical protein